MFVYLMKTPDNWLVTFDTSNNEVDYQECKTIEIAAELMEKLGVNSDDIDSALCEMVAYGHTSAAFGKYSYTCF